MTSPIVDLLKAYTNFTYGGPSTATFEDENGELHRIEVQRGVRQGDPCGPILFCLAIQPVLEKVANKFKGRIDIVAYLDDIAIIANKDVQESELKEATKMLIAEMKNIGLTLKEEYDSMHDEEFRYLGAAITRDKKKTAEALGRVRPHDKLEHFVAVVSKMTTDKAFLLLRSCGVSRGGYVARIHGVEAKQWLEAFDHIIGRAASHILEAGFERVMSCPMLRRATKLGGFGLTQWAPIADLAHKSALEKLPMSRVLEAAEKSADAAQVELWKQQYEGSVPDSFLATAEKPLTGEEFSTLVKLRAGLPQVTNQRDKKAGVLHCTGCATACPNAKSLIDHALKCPKVSGYGNITRRHTATCEALKKQLNSHQKSVNREVVLKYPARNNEPEKEGRMDLVTGAFAIDMTVTSHPAKQIATKTKKYGEICKHNALRFYTIAISPVGRIWPQSLKFTRYLAKSCNCSFNEFWAPILLEVIRGSVRAVIETRNLINTIATHNTSRAVELSIAGQSTVPAHLHTSSLAQDVDASKVDLVGVVGDDEPLAGGPADDELSSSDFDEDSDETIDGVETRQSKVAEAPSARPAFAVAA